MIEDIKKGEIKQERVLYSPEPVLTLGSRFFIWATVLVFILVLGFWGYLLNQKNTLKKLESKTASLEKELLQLSDLDKQVQAFFGAVSNIQAALSQKQKWSVVFRELNAITPKNATYTNFSTTETGSLKIDGHVPSFSSLAQVILALKESQKFKNVSLTSTSISPEKVSFSLTFELGGIK